MAAARRFSVVLVAACPFPAPRGTPVRIARMAEALADRGHDVRVVAYHLSDGADPRGVEVRRTPEVVGYTRLRAGPSVRKLLEMDPLLIRTLRAELARRRPQIVHAHHVEGLGAALAVAPAGLPVVYDAHTLLESELPHYGPRGAAGLVRRCGRWVDGALARRADHVATVTEAIAGTLRRDHAVAPDRVSVVPNGVEWPRFEAQRSRPPRPNIVFAGGLTPYQGIETLLKAFARVRRIHGEVRLTLAVAEPADFGPWRPLCRRLGLVDAVRVRRTVVGDLPDVLARATLAVNPRPRAEGQPLKLLNYMCAGAPIVSCRGSAHGLAHDENAWLVDDDPPSLADGLRRMLDDPDRAERLGAAARRAARALPSWPQVAGRLEEIYGRLLAAPGGRRPGRRRGNRRPEP